MFHHVLVLSWLYSVLSRPSCFYPALCFVMYFYCFILCLPGCIFTSLCMCLSVVFAAKVGEGMMVWGCSLFTPLAVTLCTLLIFIYRCVVATTGRPWKLFSLIGSRLKRTVCFGFSNQKRAWCAAQRHGCTILAITATHAAVDWKIGPLPWTPPCTECHTPYRVFLIHPLAPHCVFVGWLVGWLTDRVID